MNTPAAPGGDGPVHWLDGLRCAFCLALNASWLTYSHEHGPTVGCEHCGQTTRVIGPDDGPREVA